MLPRPEAPRIIVSLPRSYWRCVADPSPDLRQVFDRLFSRPKTAPKVAGHALFERKPPRLSAAGRRSDQLWKWVRRKIQAPCVGVDLGSGAVKLVRVEHPDGIPKITGAACEEYPPDVSEEEKTAFLCAKLREFRKRGLLAGRAAFGISDDRVAVESMSMPKMPVGDLARALSWEAKERMGADPATHCVRHLMVEERQVDGQMQMEVLVFVVPRQEVVWGMEMISAQGCRVTAAEPGILATAALLERAALPSADGFWAVLDVGFRYSTLACVVGGRVRFVRSFSIAGEAMTRSVADYCKIASELAEEQKRTFGLDPAVAGGAPREPDAADNDLQVRVSHAMVMHLDRLITEVDQSLRYVTYYSVERGRSAPLQALYLTGGGALLGGFPEFVAGRLNVKVEVVNPFQKMAVSEEVQRLLETQVPPIRLTEALGQALREEGGV